MKKTTWEGEPPLCVAVRYNRPLICETLLQLDYENRKTPESILRSKNRRDETPLFIAVENSNIEIVELLIRNGSNPVEPCIRGWPRDSFTEIFRRIQIHENRIRFISF